jgi:hypothetical protein
LANKFEKKNSWAYPILGIVAYYAGSIIVGGIVIFALIEFVFDSYLESYSDSALGIMLMPFGIASVYFLYKFLERKWKKEFIPIGSEIQDIGKSHEELEENN